MTPKRRSRGGSDHNTSSTLNAAKEEAKHALELRAAARVGPTKRSASPSAGSGRSGSRGSGRRSYEPPSARAIAAAWQRDRPGSSRGRRAKDSEDDNESFVSVDEHSTHDWQGSKQWEARSQESPERTSIVGRRKRQAPSPTFKQPAKGSRVSAEDAMEDGEETLGEKEVDEELARAPIQVKRIRVDEADTSPDEMSESSGASEQYVDPRFHPAPSTYQIHSPLGAGPPEGPLSFVSNLAFWRPSGNASYPNIQSNNARSPAYGRRWFLPYSTAGSPRRVGFQDNVDEVPRSVAAPPIQSSPSRAASSRALRQPRPSAPTVQTSHATLKSRPNTRHASAISVQGPLTRHRATTSLFAHKLTTENPQQQQQQQQQRQGRAWPQYLRRCRDTLLQGCYLTLTFFLLLALFRLSFRSRCLPDHTREHCFGLFGKCRFRPQQLRRMVREVRKKSVDKVCQGSIWELGTRELDSPPTIGLPEVWQEITTIPWEALKEKGVVTDGLEAVRLQDREELLRAMWSTWAWKCRGKVWLGANWLGLLLGCLCVLLGCWAVRKFQVRNWEERRVDAIRVIVLGMIRKDGEVVPEHVRDELLWGLKEEWGSLGMGRRQLRKLWPRVVKAVERESRIARANMEVHGRVRGHTDGRAG